MKIRDKLFLGFGLYIVLATILGFFAYKELRTIGTRLTLVETADDITNTILEVRRYEKNFLLFKDKASFEELQKYLVSFKSSILSIQAEIVHEIGSENYMMMKSAIAAYERQMTAIADTFRLQQELERQIRLQGRQTERAVTGVELQSLLVLRRYEKNVMIYKNKQVYDVFKQTYDASQLGSHPEVRHYQAIVARLYSLYEAEKQSVDKMRLTAREIQTFTQNLSKKERSDIATTIRVSINLQVVALALVVVVGTIINIKLATSIATPLRTLEKISRKISEGDFPNTSKSRARTSWPHSRPLSTRWRTGSRMHSGPWSTPLRSCGRSRPSLWKRKSWHWWASWPPGLPTRSTTRLRRY